MLTSREIDSLCDSRARTRYAHRSRAPRCADGSTRTAHHRRQRGHQIDPAARAGGRCHAVHRRSCKLAFHLIAAARDTPSVRWPSRATHVCHVPVMTVSSGIPVGLMSPGPAASTWRTLDRGLWRRVHTARHVALHRFQCALAVERLGECTRDDMPLDCDLPTGPHPICRSTCFVSRY